MEELLEDLRLERKYGMGAKCAFFIPQTIEVLIDELMDTREAEGKEKITKVEAMWVLVLKNNQL